MSGSDGLAEPRVTSKGRGRVDSLDVARGGALVYMLMNHFFGRLPPGVPLIVRHLLARVTIGAWLSLDCFFLMSGYLLGTILMRNREKARYFGPFYGRRVVRILPMYSASLVLFLVFRIVHDGQATADVGFFKPFTSIWPYLTMTQNIVWAGHGQWGPGWLAVTWSLAVEEQFYLLLPAIIRFTPARVLPRLLVALIILAPVVRTLLKLASVNTLALYVLFPCRMDALFLGVLVAWVRLHVEPAALARWTPRFRWFALAGAAAFAGLVIVAPRHLDLAAPAMQTFGYTFFDLSLAASLLLMLARFGADWAMPTWLRPLRWLGLTSYPIYLLHRPTQFVVEQIAGVQGMTGVFLSLAIALGLGTVCWLGIEQPLIAWGAKRFCYTGVRSSSPLGAPPSPTA